MFIYFVRLKKNNNMKNFKVNSIVILIAIWFFLTMLGIRHLENGKVNEKDKQEKLIKKLKRKIKKLENEVDNLNYEIDDLEDRIDDLE